MKRDIFFVGVFALAVAGTVGAEEPGELRSAQEPVMQPSSPASGEFEPTKELIDVIRELRHKPPPPPSDPDDFVRF